MIIVKVKFTFNITGRGTCLVVSLKENNIQISDLNTGQEISYEGEIYVIRAIEAVRKLNDIDDTVGLIVKKNNYIASMEKEFYKYTFAELTAKLGLEVATAKVKFYQEMLEKYPNTKCLKQSNLLNTYEE